MFDYNLVYKTTLKYFNVDDLATKKWIDKYCLKDKRGVLYEQSPDDMHRRIAKELARIELNYPNPVSEEEIYNLLKDFKYIVPQGSPMYGIGNPYSITSLSNCFVIGNDSDSYGGIMRTDQEQVQLMKRRGGVGHDISHLRPSGSLANNSVLGSRAGAILYMERYSDSTREVAQDGRRGALMLSIHVNHPDAEGFVDIKLEQGKVTGANISVKITDEFMKAVKNNSDFIQTFPVDADSSMIDYSKFEYNKLYKWEEFTNNDHYKGNEPKYFKKIKAKELWNKIVKNAHASAEPGILFWDKIAKESPADCYGEEWKTRSTNPCGEIPLCPYDSCRLMAINLYSYIDEPFTTKASFNFDKFREHVRIAQRIMDDLVDLEIEKIDRIINKIKSDPEPDDIKNVELNVWLKIKEKAVNGRRTGLGITAEGDMLAAIGLQYGNDVAIKFSTNIHKILAVESYKSSIEMAKERGSFPVWEFTKECENPFIKRIYAELNLNEQKLYFLHGRRNISNLTIAPTGTVSLMTQTTSGIEPLFLPYYKRRAKTEDPSRIKFTDEIGDTWEEYFVFHPKFIEWYNKNWYKISPHLFDIDYHKPIEEYDERGLKLLFEKSPYFKATANDIDWIKSVKMQGEIQKWVDHSISKTVNIPKETPVGIVNKIYLTAHAEGCKGVTIYRDGSRSGVLLKIEEKDTKHGFDYSDSYKRPKVTECDIYHKQALGKKWTVLVGKVDGKPFEIFTVAQIENHVFPTRINHGKITKVKSKTYRLEGTLEGKTYVIENFISMMSEDERTNTRKYSAMLRHGMNPKFIVREISEFATVVSFDKVIQRVLMNYVDEQVKEKCPNCGSDNYHAHEGCWACKDCGYAKCG